MSHKDNDRARVEKDLEKMMGNDWRLFRARLVAKEQIEEEELSEARRAAQYRSRNNQNQFGSFFKSAASTVSHSRIDRTASNSHYDDFIFGDESIPCEDPFVSPDEVLSYLKPRTLIDDEHWAHPIEHIEPGCVLLATERLRGIFRQAVVLVIDHSDEMGSIGIIINRPLPGNLQKIASETPFNINTDMKLAFGKASVSYGGPVMPEEYSILHGFGGVEGSKKVSPGVFVGGSKELMNEVWTDLFNPTEALFVKGNSAWMPNELTQEVRRGVWYPASVSAGFILRHAQDGSYNGDLWYDIMSCMGGRYADIANRHADGNIMMP
eukprot:CAMPEP_0172487750 /NCGR_PEP_ID=MMETSP1066-20121228/16958_1 /TAXON_ID=671091 /ORGANISM="Coscinodiscus wailesii, Strain CCMP2513" /LENGTH=322 /DNA_ID=CAMNT_0013254557 /DNA_START=201 /DNA_END=1169 /DNA_ORIENTATION=-